jgi:hypothetical protein
MSGPHTLSPAQKKAIAARLINAMADAVHCGRVLGVHPESLRLWIDGTRTALTIHTEADRGGK